MENYHLNEQFSRIAFWGKFLGYLFVVLGALSALSGLFAFVVGAVPGVLMIFLGLYLLRSGKEAEKLKVQLEEKALYELVLNYAKFLRLQGILSILGLVMFVVEIVAIVALGFTGFTNMM